MVIKTKIITIIAISIILTVGVATTVVLRMQHQKLIEDKLADTIFLGDIIEKAIENSMRNGRSEDVQKILENIGKNNEIIHVRILSPEGLILRSTNISEINSHSPEYIRFPLKGKGHRPDLLNESTINWFKNIKNRPECFHCHNKEQIINGIIQIKHNVKRSMSTMLFIKRLFVISSIIIVITVSFVISILFSRLIMKPLKNLLATMHEVESGNWLAKAEIYSNDELGLIGSSFNKMIDEINRLFKTNLKKERELSKMKTELENKNMLEDLNMQLEFKIKELETANKAITALSKEVKAKNVELERAVERLKRINEIGRILTSVIETEELMKIITRTAADLINTEIAILYINDNRSLNLAFRFSRGSGVEVINNSSGSFEIAIPKMFKTDGHFFTSYRIHEDTIINRKEGRIAVPLRIKGQIIGAMILENKVNKIPFTDEDMELLYTIANHAIVSIENARLYESLKNNYFATIQTLVNALEANDRFTKGHSERVRLLSIELGRYIGLDMKELEILEHAAILHDIGKIGIDSFIIQKQGKLTSGEYDLIKSHPQIGDEILGPIETLESVRKTIIQHHERYDGKGYPFGLSGDELSLKSKILSVVDTFDAMMSDRPYRKALSLYTIKNELLMNAGTQFDPYVVKSFIDMINQKGEDFLESIGYNNLRVSF